MRKLFFFRGGGYPFVVVYPNCLAFLSYGLHSLFVGGGGGGAAVGWCISSARFVGLLFVGPRPITLLTR